MASPQIENGHIKIANEIWDALLKITLNEGERKCLFVVLRKTYGWNKKQDAISLSQFVQITGLSRVSVCRATKSLVNRGLLGSKRSFTTSATTYWFIKDYDKWKASKLPATSVRRLTRTSKLPVLQLVNLQPHTKDTIQKTNKDKAKRVCMNTPDKYPFLTDPAFLDMFNSFLDMRKKIRKPATDLAKSMILKKLHTVDINTSIQTLEKSILKSWSDVYIEESIERLA